MNFPRAVTILDFRHASEHLSDFAKQYAPGEKAKKLLERWCHKMKHQGGTAVVKMLIALEGKAMSATVREEYERLLNYLRKNEHRTDYPQPPGPLGPAELAWVDEQLKRAGRR
jgi:hypothetical protein